ncbi:hypothetical protein HYPSUDRAFT_61726 [Hypholoma sublateritium FD-334 SS-4]|uniref:F-box domain-containing protein n=1 Tax=Hypholoma sublateritium (strain FD-334 SS-4) TaxID=945553 RepID=A0A0D2LLN5_HYPSF|nr:hypothetical protein HYPSUDRAFT_61726 [Hypholoma sublateritium FD-334 SS-4]
MEILPQAGLEPDQLTSMRSLVPPFTPQDGCSTPDILPPELLALIFIFAQAVDKRVSRKVPFEVQLSHVSRRWREVALTTPALWTNISITSRKSKKWVGSYLQRSGCLPLCIFIDIYEWDKKKPSMFKPAFTKQIYDQISAHLWRVRKLSIFCYLNSTASLMQSQFIGAPTPMLESFSVNCDDAPLNFPPATDSVQIFSGGSPKLTFVDTSSIDLLNPSVGLQNVTTLFIHLNHSKLSYPQLVALLTGPKSLVNVSITGFSDTLRRTWPVHSIHHDASFVLPSLKSLRLISSGELATRLLLSISAPTLESLWLDSSFNHFPTFFGAPQMAHALGRAVKFQTVQYLTLREYNLREVSGVARAFPDITHLHLLHASYSNPSLLTAALSTSWHRLHSLVFTIGRVLHWDEISNELSSILPERSEAGYPIQNLILDRDFRKKLEEYIPGLSNLATIVDLGPETYREPWWNNEIGEPL